MSGKMIAFMLNALIGAGFTMVGIYLIFSKREKPMHFWANTKPAPIPKENVYAYNRAVGKLWVLFGICLILIGVPILANNEGFVMVTVVGMPLLVIVLMILYIFKVESKYREK